MSHARLISVIETSDLAGKGVEGDPVRRVMQYWTMDGVLLAERDTWARPTPAEPET